MDVAGELGTLLSGLSQLIRPVALPPGMSLAQGRALARLLDSGPQRVTVLADLEQVSQPTMSALVSGLERRGWAERRPDRADRRAVLVRLTGAGRMLLAEIFETRSQTLRTWMGLLSEEDRAVLARALPAVRQLVAVAQRRHSDSDPPAATASAAHAEGGATVGLAGPRPRAVRTGA
jgi:DNA-binding MarR family transcriptional regulator